MSGPQRRRVAENSTGSENTVLARAATSVADDVDLGEWPILDAWDTILANQSTYDSTAAGTQTESIITCDRATGEPLSTAEVNMQASVEGRHAGTQTEADYIDGYTGLPPGMSLRAVARTVREMATASAAQIVGRLVREYGGVAESQRRELLLMVGAMTHAQRQVARELQQQALELARSPPAERVGRQQALLHFVDQLSERPALDDP